MNIALLSIRPRYSEAILQGSKQVEFRRRPFGKEVKYVVIYASSPIMKMVGYFEVKKINIVNIDEAWEKYSKVGCISQDEFLSYYQGKDHVVAIEILNATRLFKPLMLNQLNKSYSAPQSYRYLDYKDFQKLADDIQIKDTYR